MPLYNASQRKPNQDHVFLTFLISFSFFPIIFYSSMNMILLRLILSKCGVVNLFYTVTLIDYKYKIFNRAQ